MYLIVQRALTHSQKRSTEFNLAYLQFTVFHCYFHMQWLVGWSVGLFVGWLVACLVGWFSSCLAGWLIDLMIGCLVVW